MLPIILKYLSIFGCINTKSFIIFKLKNENIINRIIQILSSKLKSEENHNNNTNIEENINDVINQLNSFKIINNYIKNDFSNLNKYDYNFECFEKLSDNNTSINEIKINSSDKNNLKQKNLKEKIKNRIKSKTSMFLDNVKNDKQMLDEINNKNEIESNFDNKNESMCFFCRNKIELNSFDEPYGKGGYILSDYFYSNSLNASIKSELKKIKKEEYYKDDLSQKDPKLSTKLISCGHYFHFSCFKAKNFGLFTCPLCLKN